MAGMDSSFAMIAICTMYKRDIPTVIAMLKNTSVSILGRYVRKPTLWESSPELLSAKNLAGRFNSRPMIAFCKRVSMRFPILDKTAVLTVVKRKDPMATETRRAAVEWISNIFPAGMMLAKTIWVTTGVRTPRRVMERIESQTIRTSLTEVFLRRKRISPLPVMGSEGSGL